jgi:PAS domain S-box-containing protein
MSLLGNTSSENKSQGEKQDKDLKFILSDFEEISRGWIWELNLDGELTFVSNKLGRVFGETKESMFGRQLIQCVVDTYPEEQAGEGKSLRVKWEHYLKTPSTIQDMPIRIWMNGEAHWWSMTAKPLFSQEREHSGWRGISIDITSRRQAEEKLGEQEKKYRFIANNSIDVIWTVDSNYKFTYISPSIYQLRGLTQEEAIKESIEQTMPPQSIAILYQVIQEATRKKTEGYPISFTRFELEQYHKDGRLIWVEITIKRFLDDQKNTIGWLGVSRDISEHKRMEDALRKSEQKFSKSFMLNPAGMAIFEILDQIYFADINEVFCQITGYQRDDIIGRPVEDLKLVAPDSLAEIFKKIKAEGQIQTIEYHFQKKNGETGACLLSAYRFVVDRKPFAIVSVIDISELKLSKEKLELTLNQLHTLSAHLQTIREEERSAISREIHDELGQSLTGLKMELFWLKGQASKKNLPEYKLLAEDKLTAILQEIDQTIDWVRQISTFLRPGILDTLGLIPALSWLADDFEARYKIKCWFQTTINDIKFEKNFSTAIFRVCQEALTNVARHACASRVAILLQSQKEELILTIEDNGRGISEEEINHPNSLGLLGIKERALTYQGTVVFSKSPNGGTLVLVKFPKVIV